jgi:hypothetical protein
MISGLGSSFVQLVIALRWMTAMWPWKGFATAQIVSIGTPDLVFAGLNSAGLLA